MDEDVNDTEGKTEEQIQTEIELKDTRTRAQILEMVENLFIYFFHLWFLFFISGISGTCKNGSNTVSS